MAQCTVKRRRLESAEESEPMDMGNSEDLDANHSDSVNSIISTSTGSESINTGDPINSDSSICAESVHQGGNGDKKKGSWRMYVFCILV